MSRISGCRGLVCAFALTTAVPAHADLAGAQTAYAAKDYARAFGLFREIAELGNLTAQENIAAMYVDGEGVNRDNAMGYAWALIARENGGNAAMKNIIDQLQPHMNDAERARIAEITATFGAAALKERLLPEPPTDPSKPREGPACKITRPRNPDDFYPKYARKNGISGTVLVESVVMADGRVHVPHVLYSLPAGIFDEAARAHSFASTFSATPTTGIGAQCVIRYKIRFRAFHSSEDRNMTDAFKKFKPLAEAGDPEAQMYYGLLMSDRVTGFEADHDSNEWILKAAQAGIPYAQYLIGVQELMRSRHASKARIDKGLAWLRLSAAGGQADAKAVLANYILDHQPDAAANAQVMAWLEDAARAQHRDGILYLAGLLATGPDPARRDPARALTLLDGIALQVQWDPASYEARAAAQAQLGDFEAAQREQKRALKQAGDLGWDKAPLQARLAGYEKGQTWVGNLFAEWSLATN